jgi:ubiquitin C-terminal hydrolase
MVHIKDLNTENKFGYGGKLAISFGRLANELYTTNRKSINPKQFAVDVANMNRQFSGNQQQDAQELLTFLLDGLNEDLNLVHNKPYTEHPDSGNRPDEELADIWWKNHLIRDLSVVQALFCGQFKSVMTCGCGYSSARFEPFTCLTVPLPEEVERRLYIRVVARSVGYITLCVVRVDKNDDLNGVMDIVR